MNTPAVIITESDKSNITISENSKNITFFAGYFHRGEINRPTYFNSVVDFKHYYGIFNESNINDWYQVYNYFQYSNNIIVTRCVDESKDLFNSSASLPNSTPPITILNKEDFDYKDEFEDILSNNYINVIANTPGEWGNKISFALFTLKEFNRNVVIYNNTRVKDIVNYMEEGDYCIVVIYNNTIVEIFNKKYSDIEEINNESKYIYVKHDLLNYTVYDGNIFYIDGNIDKCNGNEPYDYETGIHVAKYGDNIIKLSGGISYSPRQVDIENAYNEIKDEKYYINFIIGNERNNNASINLANYRKDCIAFVGIPKLNYNESLAYVKDLLPSEFTCIIGNYKKQYDNKYSKDIYVNFAGDIAGLRSSIPVIESYCNMKYKILGCVNINMRLVPKDINTLYKNNVNCVTIFDNRAVINTERLNCRPNHISNVTNRNIFNLLYKECTAILSEFLFELNNEIVVENIKSKLNILLHQFKYRNEISNYKIIVRQTDKEIITDIIIQPNYLVNFVRLRFINQGT